MLARDPILRLTAYAMLPCTVSAVTSTFHLCSAPHCLGAGLQQCHLQMLDLAEHVVAEQHRKVFGILQSGLVSYI